MPQKIDRHRSTVICLNDSKILGFHAEDPTSQKKYFFLPGGKIEDGESAAESALREALEETGYELILHSEFHIEKTYDFFWDGKLYRTRTEFFAASLKNPAQTPEVVEDATYHRGVDWLSVENISTDLNYNDEIYEVVQAAIRFFKKPNEL